MIHCRLRAIAVPLLVAGLAACAVPRPFAHDVPGEEELARLRNGGGVAVLPPAGAPPPFVTAAPAGLAEALQEAAVPAQAVSEPGVRDYRITSRFAFVAPPVPDKVAAQVDWEVLGPQGQSLAVRRQQVVLPLAKWTDADALRAVGAEVAADLGRALEADVESPLTTAQAAAVPGEQAGPAATAAAPLVRVRVDGLEGARASALRSAMEAALKRRGLRIADAGTPVGDAMEVTGTFARDAAQTTDAGVVVPLRIDWTVAGAEGQDLGRASQRNAVPAAVLEGQFTTLAVMIAQAAAEGIVAVVRQHGAE